MKVVCDVVALRRWVEATSPRVSPLLAGTEGEDGGAYLRRKRLDRVVDEEADRASNELGRVVSDALAGCADAVAPAGASCEPDGTGRAVVGSDAFLVPDERSDEFRRIAEETETLLCDRGVEVRVTGPLPLYHFVSVDLRENARG